MAAAAGVLVKGGKKLLKWGADILGDVVEETKKVKKTKKPKPKVSKKPKVKVSKKPKATKAKGKKGRKRIPRGRIPAAVQEIMDELNVDRKEATKILAARQKAAAKAAAKAKQKKPTEAQAEEIEKWATVKPIRGRVPKGWRNIQKAQERELAGQSKIKSGPGRRKEYVGDKATGAEKLKYFDEFGERIYKPVEEGPALSRVKLPTNLSQAQKRRFKMTGQAKPMPKSRRYPEGLTETGEYAPPASEIRKKMGTGGGEDVTEGQVKEIMEMVERGDLTLKKKGGTIKSKKSKRKSASKPKGVGQAMRGWGATMKRRT